MKKTIVVLGSSRSDGNTRRVINYLNTQLDFDFVDLNDYKIGYFDYEFRNKDDDFWPVIEKVIEYDNIVFATPVYWYSMSAVLKTFFDRISDLLKIRRDLKPKLVDKKLYSLSCSGANDLGDYFHMPFQETAIYLKMKYGGHTHSWVDGDLLPAESKRNLVLLSNRIK